MRSLSFFILFFLSGDPGFHAQSLKDFPVAVVYIWSPHMPLSLDGAREAFVATKALKLPLFLALEPSSDNSLTLPVPIEKKDQNVFLFYIKESLELSEYFNSDLDLHVPTLLVFSYGKMISSPLLGYKDRNFYKDFIRQYAQRT